MSTRRFVLDFKAVISSLSCVILYALKELMVIAALERLIAINHLGQAGAEISVVCGRALIMSLKSSMMDPMVIRLTSVVDLAMVLNSSSCLSNSCSYVAVMVCCMSKIWLKLNGIWTGM
jgi:hypothetical protein